MILIFPSFSLAWQPLGGSNPWESTEREKQFDLTTWNVDVFVESASTLFHQLDWVEVMNQLDQPDFIVNDVTGFHMILSIFKQACPVSICTALCGVCVVGSMGDFV